MNLKIALYSISCKINSYLVEVGFELINVYRDIIETKFNSLFNVYNAVSLVLI